MFKSGGQCCGLARLTEVPANLHIANMKRGKGCVSSAFLRIAIVLMAAGIAGCDRPPSPLEMLEERGIEPGGAALNEAANTGNLEVIQWLLAVDVPVSRTAVESAVLNDRAEVLTELLAAPGGRKIAEAQWDGLLDASVRIGASSVLRILLDLQPGSELRLGDGEPALVFAVKSDSPELAATLMSSQSGSSRFQRAFGTYIGD